MKIKSFLVILVFLLCCHSLFGQNTSSRDNKMDTFSFKMGKWKWKTKGYAQAGDTKPSNGIGYSHVYFINDSTSILDDHKIEWENGVVYRAITYRTYDEQNNSYMVVWAQSGTGYTIKIAGHWEGDKFVELNTGTNSNGNWTNRLEIYDIEQKKHKAKLVRTYEDGRQIILIEYIATKIY